MQLSEAMTRGEEDLRKVKEDSVKRKVRNMQSMVAVYRGGEHVCAIQVNVDRDSLIAAFTVAAHGFNADVIVMGFETWMSGPALNPAEINPVTGRRMEQGGLQELVEHHYGLERGWVVDAIQVQGVNRAGDQSAKTMRYKMKGTRSMEWLPELDWQGEDMAMGGAMPAAFARIMRDVKPALLAGELIRESFPQATSYEAQRAGSHAEPPERHRDDRRGP